MNCKNINKILEKGALMFIILHAKMLLDVSKEPLTEIQFFICSTVINFVSYQGKFLKASQLSYILLARRNLFLMGVLASKAF